ncbi:transporter substrate-binding domain-containing protein [Maribellus sp. YY47]|uniref:transporter substrate-binding domain-containing protein n=1 Tax=Maribellus sp. YY47 TaxID=2929486 RepID=UPI00200084EC|nr:transporter substrate-binding domain-containing protein [Maribellus sp. YY47]MCK3683712.1 transporter substrate-binding domain-containing protein [Maribellus sp. YY47]
MGKQLRYLLFITLIVFTSCGLFRDRKAEKEREIKLKHDLPQILDDGVLNVITSYSGTSYFLYKGQPMGYEYELLKRFAKHLGVEVNISVSNNIDTMFYQLGEGNVDLIAHGLTVTNERKKKVTFSDYLYLTHQVLVQRKPENYRKMKWSEVQASLVHDAIELIGDTVSVSANTSYFARLANLSEEIGGEIHIDTLPGDLSTDKIIEMVANGEIKYTVADNNIASINASYYPELDIRVPISFSQRMAWALRPQSKELEKALNEWIKTMKDGVAYYAIYNKYFKNERDFRSRENSDFYSLNNNRVSVYDELIQASADTLGWDWRLMASMVFQESKFNPNLESWAGAKGLMQLMPATAERFGVKDRANPEQSIEAATKILKILWDRFEEIPDSIQRIKFTMAAYNCGYGHVEDARNLAILEKLDPKVWDKNVEETMLKLSYPENYNKRVVKYGYVRGVEPYTYVKEVFDRFENYVLFLE